MDTANTAVVLIGFQNDYFASDGVLKSFLEPESAASMVLKNTVSLIEALKDSPTLIVSTPIAFSSDYHEILAPVGVLKTIQDIGAFQRNTSGVETVPELRQYKNKIIELPGKRGLNAFSDTQLDHVLRSHNIDNIVIAGVISSVCVDSTGRAAVELGYRTLILSDCTWGRTEFEQEFYCSNVFPLYAKLIDSESLLQTLKSPTELELPLSTQSTVETLVNQGLFEKLVDAETRYRDLLNNLHNIVIGYDQAGLLNYVNPAWSEVLGIEPNKTIGQPLEKYIIEEDRSLWHELAEKSVISGKRQEIRMLTADGDIRWFEFSVRPSSEGGVGLLYDITSSKAEQRRLEKTVEKTQSATDEKSRFLATMSHEIRTPMNGVIGMTDLLLRTNLDEKQQRYVETLRGSGDAMLTLIDDILDFSKIEAGKLKILNSLNNPRKLILEVCDLFQSRVEQKGLELHYTIDDGLPHSLECDGTRIKQLLNNLLSNAIKCTNEGSIHICVQWNAQATQQGNLVVSVKDTGIGIAAQHHHLLFQPFSQIDSTNTRHFGGTGLGLAICAKLTELMRGSIDLHSVERKGSTLTFSLPLTVSNERKPHTIAQSGFGINNIPLAQCNPLTILVAEDDQTNQMIISDMLRTLGYESDTASCGTEVLQRCKSKQYDLVLMDIHMPEMDGLEATRLLRKQSDHNIPDIIAISADVLSQNKQTCFDLGMIDFISKPIKIETLRSCLLKVTAKAS